MHLPDLRDWIEAYDIDLVKLNVVLQNYVVSVSEIMKTRYNPYTDPYGYIMADAYCQSMLKLSLILAIDDRLS